MTATAAITDAPDPAWCAALRAELAAAPRGRHDPRREPEDEEGARTTVRASCRGHIVLVEDDTELREVLASVLRTYGYDVTEYGGGQDAIKAMSDDYTKASASGQNRLLPDCIVFDLMMPAGDGAWLWGMLGVSERFRSVPRLAMSNDDRLDEFVRWATQRPELGKVPGTLAKPFDGRAFVERVEIQIAEGRGAE